MIVASISGEKTWRVSDSAWVDAVEIRFSEDMAAVIFVGQLGSRLVCESIVVRDRRDCLW